MSYHLFYHPDVTKDLAQLPKNIKNRIGKAIEARLINDPFNYGDPLKRSLQSFRKLRVGDYRVIYKVEGNQVIVLKIGHRKEVYEKVFSRI